MQYTNKATADGLYIALQSKVYRMQEEIVNMKNEPGGEQSSKVKKMKAYVDLMKESGVID